MKTFACVLLVVLVSVAAEPPRFRKARFEFQRQEVKRSEEKEPTTPKADEAPYAPSGFKPSKEFNLPSRQEASPPSTSYGVPADSYGAPLNVFSAPETEYGVPKSEGGEEKEEKEGEEPEGKEVEGLKAEGEKKKEKLSEGEGAEEGKEESESNEVVNQQGAYYVLLPDSQLQRVQFQTQNDIRNMAYTARLQYKNEDRAPIYVYAAVPNYQRAAYIQLV